MRPEPIDRHDDFPTPRRWKLSGDMDGLAAPRPGGPPRPAGPPGPGQLRRRRRNLLIALAAANGMSERWIADAVDLPRSRVNAILAEFRGAWEPRDDEGE